LDIISKQFNDFSNENKLLKSKIENLESKISTLEAKRASIIEFCNNLSLILIFNVLIKYNIKVLNK